MTGNIDGPRREEARLKSRLQTRARWLTRSWITSAKGNEFLNIGGHNLGVFEDKTGFWRYRYESEFFPESFSSKNQAKLALFDLYWNRKRNLPFLPCTTP